MRHKTLFAAALMLLAVIQAPAQEGAPSNRLVPSKGAVKKSPYRGHTNFGASIAVFGGSLSETPESAAAKQQWADLLGAEVVTYGVGGSGFSIDQGYSVQKQVDGAGVHDVYILWASTNDYVHNRECGTWKDYTELDGFDESRRATQCGGINYCIKKILEINPKARIYFFTSLRFFRSDSGHNPFSAEKNNLGLNFADYIEAQKACCAHHGIPVLDQFAIEGINSYNYEQYYLPDKLHLTEEGYRFLGPVQAAFLADGR